MRRKTVIPPKEFIVIKGEKVFIGLKAGFPVFSSDIARAKPFNDVRKFETINNMVAGCEMMNL